jgi:hypothetical protein
MARATPGAKTAIVRPSSFARVITNIATSLFSMPARMFAPTEVEAAYDYAAVPPLERRNVARAVDEMRQELGV